MIGALNETYGEGKARVSSAQLVFLALAGGAIVALLVAFVVVLPLVPPHTLSSSHPPHEAILTTVFLLLFDRALLYQPGEDRADCTSRSVCRFIHMLNQEAQFHRFFAQSGNDCIGCRNIGRRAARQRVDAPFGADDFPFRKQKTKELRN